jgi:hypothetical protein
MKIYDYKNYDEYVSAQIEGNVRKLTNSYVDPNSIELLVNHLYNEFFLKPSTIICHGTRRGLEQRYFLNSYELIGIRPNVIGTEISHTAENYPNTIQWDFHNVKDEWINSIDLIYSNAFDHSYKPIECLDMWMSCLSVNGKCVIEYSYECDTKSGKTDPFAATLDEYREFIEKKYIINSILTNEGLQDLGLTHKGIRYFIIISNK